jgi:hypothetical protein
VTLEAAMGNERQFPGRRSSNQSHDRKETPMETLIVLLAVLYLIHRIT